MTVKYCPYCKHRITTLSLNDVGTSSHCEMCGKPFDISITSSDRPAHGHAGGFRLVKPPAPSLNNLKVLRFISRKQPTHAMEIALNLGRSPHTIRRYLHKLESAGLIQFQYSGNYKMYSVLEASV